MSEPATDSVRLDLPVSGMTCAACSTRLEKLLNRLPGVAASVNLASEHALVEITGQETNARQVVAAIEKAGFSVAPRTLQLAIEGMTCAACSTRLEKLLNRLPGVEAVVNLASERATVRYLPGSSLRHCWSPPSNVPASAHDSPMSARATTSRRGRRPASRPNCVASGSLPR